MAMYYNTDKNNTINKITVPLIFQVSVTHYYVFSFMHVQRITVIYHLLVSNGI